LNLKQEETKLRKKNLDISLSSLTEYINEYGCNEDHYLYELRKETKKLGDVSIMQIGATQGSLLKILCSIGNFKKCLEIGVFTGYSSICIAQAMKEDGEIIALDNNKEYTDIAMKYWKLAGVNKKIKLILGDANNSLNQLLETMNESFDFIFIDADKNNYIDYYEKSMMLLKRNALMAIDNTIWKGKILDDNDNSKSTTSIRKLNEYIKNDNRVEHCILTIYDGMTLCLKK